eukprot:scaffold256449_cov28-Tisochrysis_lutea.AAC.1
MARRKRNHERERGHSMARGLITTHMTMCTLAVHRFGTGAAIILSAIGHNSQSPSTNNHPAVEISGRALARAETSCPSLTTFCGNDCLQFGSEAPCRLPPEEWLVGGLCSFCVSGLTTRLSESACTASSRFLYSGMSAATFTRHSSGPETKSL